MKEIQVIVTDRNTLTLAEDAKVGDIIRLDRISNVDTTYLARLLDEESAKKIQERIDKAVEENARNLKTAWELERKKSEAEKDEQNRQKIEMLQKKIQEAEENGKAKLLEAKNEKEKELLSAENDKNIQLEKLKAEKEKEIQKKESEIESLNKDLENRIALAKNELEKNYRDEIQKLKDDLLKAKNDSETEKKLHESEKESALQKKTNELQESFGKERLELQKAFDKEKEELKDSFQKERNELTKKINDLQLSKSVLNVKQTGENLEAWCNNIVQESMQNGFQNCTWKKDNAVVKEEGEDHGTKADFIFTIHSSKQKSDENILTKVCLDMKDENPESKNKRTNESYFKALDANRKKKGCQYAVLVSTLEADHPNDIPIRKVSEDLYPDMYVVRPAYLMTFLNMITSLTTHFASLVEEKNKEEKENRAYNEFRDTFQKLKETYLDKPLNALKEDIEKIANQNATIVKATENIEKLLAHVRDSYLEKIQSKLDNFDLKMLQADKRLSKASE